MSWFSKDVNKEDSKESGKFISVGLFCTLCIFFSETQEGKLAWIFLSFIFYTGSVIFMYKEYKANKQDQ